MGKCAWDVVADRLIWVEDGVAGLPGGLADGRYACLACWESVMLSGYKPDAMISPYFRHQNGADCADLERERQADAEMKVVIQLRDWVRAIPGFTGTVEIVGEAKGGPSGLPPVVIAHCGDTTVAIERPGDHLPGPDAVRRRVRAAREHHGVERHVWFLKKDRDQFGQFGTHTVRLGGKDTVHDTLAPNEQQQAIIAAGGHVYWLDGKLVLVPYGIHRFRHSVRAGEDWTNWPRWRDPQDDWRISKPVPSPNADYWGLVPIPLTSMTRTRAVFHPAQAHQVMDELYAGQEGRYHWRRKHARELYAARNAPATPAAVAEAADAGQLIPPALPEQQGAVPEPPAAPDQTGLQVPNEPSDQSDSPAASPAPPDRTVSAPTPEPPSLPPTPPSPLPSAPPAAPPTAPPPPTVPVPPPYPPATPPAPLPEQRPRGLRGVLRRLLGGQ
ncbi:hypothetical protein ACMATS_38060 (plasmid) [Streptoverticillium reticulum]|uniref:hypothetical protein n=1 Tax=Streptoverticillium reticulum TaxID=1433415 RepID=UPI0039BF3A28